MNNYVIELSGGHLDKPRYVTQCGLLAPSIYMAERFELSEAIGLTKLNTSETTCKMTAKFIQDDGHWTQDIANDLYRDHIDLLLKMYRHQII